MVNMFAIYSAQSSISIDLEWLPDECVDNIYSPFNYICSSIVFIS